MSCSTVKSKISNKLNNSRQMSLFINFKFFSFLLNIINCSVVCVDGIPQLQKKFMNFLLSFRTE